MFFSHSFNCYCLGFIINFRILGFNFCIFITGFCFFWLRPGGAQPYSARTMERSTGAAFAPPPPYSSTTAAA